MNELIIALGYKIETIIRYFVDTLLLLLSHSSDRRRLYRNSRVTA
jgi:hypothetical protein